MSDLLAEVDEAMRRERVEKFFKEHGKTVLAFIVLTVVMTGAISFYKQWNNNVKAAGTERLMNLIDDPAFPENIAGAELDMRGGLRGLALITAAGAFLDQGKNEQALTLYQKAASDKGLPKDLSQLATLMSIRLDQSENADPQTTLLGIWNDKNSPWRYHAHLEAAALYANKDSNFEKALEHLNLIQDAEGLPETLYSRARALNQIYSLKQKK